MTCNAVTGDATRLTDHDRRTIAQARELAALRHVSAVKKHTAETDILLAYVNALGEAQYLLGELAAALERLSGDDGQPGEDPEPEGGVLARTRA